MDHHHLPPQGGVALSDMEQRLQQAIRIRVWRAPEDLALDEGDVVVLCNGVPSRHTRRPAPPHPYADELSTVARSCWRLLGTAAKHAHLAADGLCLRYVPRTLVTLTELVARQWRGEVDLVAVLLQAGPIEEGAWRPGIVTMRMHVTHPLQVVPVGTVPVSGCL